METLKQQLQGIAKEYARQTGQLLGMSRNHWVGADGTFILCEFGESLWLTLDELQVIIDNLDKWVKIYGSREGVADAIRAWNEWWERDVIDPDKVIEVSMGRVSRRFAPRLNLMTWLMGFRDDEDRSSSDEYELESKLAIARRLIKDFGPDIELRHVADGLQHELDQTRQAAQRERDELNKALANGTAPDKLQRAYDEFHSKTAEI